MSITTSITDCLNHALAVIKAYHGLQTALHSNIYRISGVQKISENTVMIQVQVIGKAIFMEYTPQALLENASLLQGFSKPEIQFIGQLAYAVLHAGSEASASTHQIVGHELDLDQQEMYLQIQNQHAEIQSLSTRACYLDKNLKTHLNRDDLEQLAYTTGYLHGQNNQMGSASISQSDCRQASVKTRRTPDQNPLS